MSGINPQIVFAITQISTEFNDDIGNSRTGIGTGFFLRRHPTSFFVTNRHNVDPTMRLGQSWSLRAVKLLLRRYADGVPTEETRWFALDMHRSSWLHSPTADVSVLAVGHFAEQLGEFGFNVLLVDVASQSFFERRAQMMDFVSFIGYPGSGTSTWWDKRWNTPIARMATIASSPAVPFTHESVATSDVTLVSGLSFSGSSGSPVLLHQKGVRTGAGLTDPAFTPPTLLGIMSGHWWDARDEPAIFKHSGLSYFTRATSIAPLLRLSSAP